MELFYTLLVLLVVTRSFGEVAERLGQPALAGELISGIFLGAVIGVYSDVFPFLAGLDQSAVFNAITNLGMFFIMLFAGIEMQPHKIVKYSGGAVVVAIGGMIVPLSFGLALGWVFLPVSELKLAQALFIGTALAITAVPATVKILIDLKQLDSRSGQIIVSAAVFDDVLSLMLLAWLTALIAASEPPGVLEFAILCAKIAIFFGVTTIVGLYAFPWGGKFLRHVKEKEFDFSVMLIAALAFAILAEMLALHFILGAFIAGVFFGRKTVDENTYDSVRSKVSGMTFGFLAPIFFASVGLNFDMAAITEIPVFLVLLLVAAFLGKLLGAGVAAFRFGLSKGESIAVGVGMSARGAVELVIADLALSAGLFTQAGPPDPVVTHLFSSVVIMAILTTLATPILLKRIYAAMEGSGPDARSSA
jgi:Kef-type K+ transport system membrane component KefB